MKKVLLFTTIFLFFISCEKQAETPYTKVDIVDNSLIYNGQQQNKPIEDMTLFFSMYSDRELEDVLYLRLSHNSIKVISGLERFSNLKSLGLPHNNIENIENIPELETLETVALDHNKIEIIENLSYLSSLTYLDLQNNPIRKIEGLLGLQKMEYINIVSFEQPYMHSYTIDELVELTDKVEENNKETLKSGQFIY